MEKDIIVSFGVILQAIINSDGNVSEKEREKFETFFKNEFNLNSKEIEELFEQTKNKDYKEHIQKLKTALENEPLKKLNFMQFLNNTIISDGIKNEEYRVFEEIRGSLI